MSTATVGAYASRAHEGRTYVCHVCNVSDVGGQREFYAHYNRAHRIVVTSPKPEHVSYTKKRGTR